VDKVALAQVIAIAGQQAPLPPPVNSTRNIGSDSNSNLFFRTGGNTPNGFEDGIMLGRGLRMGANGQIIIGDFNEEVDDAQFILGNGSDQFRSNLLTVDAEGNVRPGNGGLFTEVDGVTVPVVYDTGEEQIGQVTTN